MKMKEKLQKIAMPNTNPTATSNNRDKHTVDTVETAHRNALIFWFYLFFYYFASFVFFIAHREHALSAAAAAYELWLKKTVHTPRAKCIIDEQKKKNKRKNNTNEK